MADLIKAKLVGTKEVQRRLKKMNPQLNRRITDGFLLEDMQLTLRIAQREKILRGGTGPPRPNILTSRKGRLRASLGPNFRLHSSQFFVEGGTDLIYGAVHENSARAFLKPALADASQRFEAIAVKHWARAGEVG